MPLTYNSWRAPLVARNYHPAHLHLIRHPFNTTQSENKQSILLKEVPYTESVSKARGIFTKVFVGYSSQNSKPLSTAPCPNWPREPRKTNTWLTERTKGTSTRHAFLARCSTDGNETWCTYMRQEHRLNSFHLQCLKRILGVKWQDQPPPQPLRFSHGRGERETSDWWWTARDHGKGTDGCLLPSFLCAHIERDVWVRGSGKTTSPIVRYSHVLEPQHVLPTQSAPPEMVGAWS